MCWGNDSRERAKIMAKEAKQGKWQRSTCNNIEEEECVRIMTGARKNNGREADLKRKDGRKKVGGVLLLMSSGSFQQILWKSTSYKFIEIIFRTQMPHHWVNLLGTVYHRRFSFSFLLRRVPEQQCLYRRASLFPPPPHYSLLLVLLKCLRTLTMIVWSCVGIHVC